MTAVRVLPPVSWGSHAKWHPKGVYRRYAAQAPGRFRTDQPDVPDHVPPRHRLPDFHGRALRAPRAVGARDPGRDPAARPAVLLQRQADPALDRRPGGLRTGGSPGAPDRRPAGPD